MTTLKWLLLIVALAYGGLLALMYVFQRALMYFPIPLVHRRLRQAWRKPRK